MVSGEGLNFYRRLFNLNFNIFSDKSTLICLNFHRCLSYFVVVYANLSVGEQCKDIQLSASREYICTTHLHFGELIVKYHAKFIFNIVLLFQYCFLRRFLANHSRDCCSNV